MTANDGRPLALRRSETVLLAIARALACFGGLVLLALAAVTVYSIVGRALPDLAGLAWWRPLRGDFELVEMGTAVAIFAFLPYAHLVRAHVVVDLVTASANARVKARLAVPGHLLLTAIAGVMTWRMAVATESFLTATYTQTTMLLGMPLWWGYLPATLCMGFLTVSAAFSVWESVDEAWRT